VSGKERGTQDRQTEILALQRDAGNQAVVTLLQREGAVATPVVTPLLPEIESRLTPWVRQNLDDTRRQYLLELYARLGDYWKHVPPKSVTYVGDHGEMDFKPADESALQVALVAAGYTDAYHAKSSENTWGLREPKVTSAGLHWRGLGVGKVNVHIDLHPPSGLGIEHYLKDQKQRSTTHTPETIRQGIKALKIEIPILSQREAHGDLTVRLHRLRARAGEGEGARSSLDLAESSLALAGSILWNRETISQDSLKNATVALGEASIELDVVEKLLRKP
jgi:hypothetical protein